MECIIKYPTIDEKGSYHTDRTFESRSVCLQCWRNVKIQATICDLRTITFFRKSVPQNHFPIILIYTRLIIMLFILLYSQSVNIVDIWKVNMQISFIKAFRIHTNNIQPGNHKTTGITGPQNYFYNFLADISAFWGLYIYSSSEFPSAWADYFLIFKSVVSRSIYCYARSVSYMRKKV